MKPKKLPTTGAEWREQATKEADVEDAIRTHLQLHGWLVFKTDAAVTVADDTFRRSALDPGTSDLIAVRPTLSDSIKVADSLWNGVMPRVATKFNVLMIECKRPVGGRLRTSQKLWHAYALKFGVEVKILKSIDAYLACYAELFPGER